MKRRFYALAALMMLLCIIVACTDSTASKKNESGILSVTDFQSNSSSIKGAVVVTGVVARVSEKDNRTFALIDTNEAKHCKSTGCAKFYLPVQFDGQQPKIWDEVNATGQIIDRGGLLFQASKLDVLRHITIH